MKEELYVIATKGRGNKEIYLKCKETNSEKVQMEWTENIDEAYATFFAFEVEDFAKNYFKNFNRWYVKRYMAKFE